MVWLNSTEHTSKIIKVGTEKVTLLAPSWDFKRYFKVPRSVFGDRKLTEKLELYAMTNLLPDNKTLQVKDITEFTAATINQRPIPVAI